jgi:hypothetical protein
LIEKEGLCLVILALDNPKLVQRLATLPPYKSIIEVLSGLPVFADWARQQGYAPLFEVNIPGLGDIRDAEFEEFSPEYITSLASRILDLSKLYRGDIVHFENVGDYRNAGTSIFDGEQLQHLESEPDEYGNTPRSFHIKDFPRTDYWSHNITYNSYVWLDTERLDLEDLRRVKFDPKVDVTRIEVDYSGQVWEYMEGYNHPRVLYDHEAWETADEAGLNF